MYMRLVNDIQYILDPVCWVIYYRILSPIQNKRSYYSYQVFHLFSWLYFQFIIYL